MSQYPPYGGYQHPQAGQSQNQAPNQNPNQNSTPPPQYTQHPQQHQYGPPSGQAGYGPQGYGPPSGQYQSPPPGQYHPSSTPGPYPGSPPQGQYGGPIGLQPLQQRPGSLMGQLNQAVNSTRPLLQSFSNKLGKTLQGSPSGPYPPYQAGPGPSYHYGPPMPGGPPGSQQGFIPQPQAVLPQQQGITAYNASAPSTQTPPAQTPYSPTGTPVSTPSAQQAPTPDVLSQDIAKLDVHEASHPATPVGGPRPRQNWTFVDSVTRSPTLEFLVIAELMYDSLNGGEQAEFIDAPKILDGWKANGLDDAHVASFSYDSYLAFKVMWSTQEIPHILIPSEPTLAPSASSAIVVPLRNSTGPPSLPTYIPALSRHSWARHLFFSFFEDPDSLPRIVRKTCGSRYDSSKHPDLTLFDTSCPHDLRETAKESRATALKWALEEVRKVQSTNQQPTVTSPGQGIGGGADGNVFTSATAVEPQSRLQNPSAAGSQSVVHLV